MVKRRMVKRKPKVYRKRKLNKKNVKRRYPTNSSTFKSNFSKVTRYPLGQSQKVVLPYVEQNSFSTTLGSRGYYSYILNSCYDPNHTGAGHQPLGFDQMTPIFGRYCVIGAQIKVTFWSKDTDELLGVGIHLSEMSTPPSNITQLIEQGAVTYRMISPTGGTYNNGVPQTIMYLNCSPKKFCKVASLLDNNDFNSSTGSNPVRPIYAHLIVFQPDGGATSATVGFQIDMRQTVVFNTPTNVTQS